MCGCVVHEAVCAVGVAICAVDGGDFGGHDAFNRYRMAVRSANGPVSSLCRKWQCRKCVMTWREWLAGLPMLRKWSRRNLCKPMPEVPAFRVRECNCFPIILYKTN